MFGLPTLPPPLNEVLLFPDGQVFADVLSLSIVSRLHMASVAQPDDDVPAFLRGDRLFVSITDLLRRDVFASREEHVVFEHVQGLVRRYARAHAMKDAAVRKVEMGKAIEELERYVNREGSEG